MADTMDVIKVLEQTARSLAEQSQVLREQSRDLTKEAARVRAASKKAREKRKAK